MRNILFVVVLLLALPAAAEPAKTLPEALYREGDHALGAKDAKIVITEYASLSCAHCAEFNANVIPVIKKDYVDSGKALFVYRHYPLNAPALKAAMLTECASQNKDFFRVLDLLFKSQKKWAFTKDFEKHLLQVARLLGMKKEAFDACLNNKELEDKILKARLEASKTLGITGTPTIFINGVKVDKIHSAESLKEYLTTLSAGQ